MSKKFKIVLAVSVIVLLGVGAFFIVSSSNNEANLSDGDLQHAASTNKGIIKKGSRERAPIDPATVAK